MDPTKDQWASAVEFTERAFACQPKRPARLSLWMSKRPLDGSICLPKVVRQWSGLSPGLPELFRQLAMGELPWPLYLHGGVGSGKTFGALCFCDIAVFGRYATVPETCDKIMGKRGGEPMWDRLKTPDLAVLDELGSRERVNELDYQAVKTFADWREGCGNLPTIYVSNHPPDTIRALYDKRIGSRLLQGTTFFLDVPDRRKTLTPPLRREGGK